MRRADMRGGVRKSEKTRARRRHDNINWRSSPLGKLCFCFIDVPANDNFVAVLQARDCRRRARRVLDSRDIFSGCRPAPAHLLRTLLRWLKNKRLVPCHEADSRV
jgi:hypothetical protein